MSTEVADARAEALRNMAAKRNFRRGSLVGGLGGAVIAMLAVVALQPSFARWLAAQTAASTENPANDDGNQAGQQQPEQEGAKPAGANASDGDSSQEPGDADDDPSGDSANSRQAETDEDPTDGQTGDQQPAESDESADGTIAAQLEAMRLALEARLTALEQAAADASSGDGLAVEQLRTALLARLDSVDDKIAQLEPIAQRYRAAYGPDDVEGERSVANFPKSELRQSRNELNDVGRAAAKQAAGEGTLVLNNTTGVAGYIYVNGETVWLDLDRNEIVTKLGDVTIEIPNGGVTYRLDGQLWRQDAAGRYVMNRPNWPPTR